MLITITSIAHDYSLLPYFLEYYRQLGVEKFYISILENALAERDFEAIVREIGDTNDVECIPVVANAWGVAGGVTEMTRQGVAKKSDWVIPADLDEFNVYPTEKKQTLRDLISTLERGNYTHVMGEMVDRVGNQKLTPLLDFEEHISLWDQYPHEISLTRDIVGGLTSKVLIARGDMPLWTGHHRLEVSGQPYLFSGNCYHFKWRKGLVEHLKKRVKNEHKEKVPWLDESLRALDYLETI